MSRHSRWSWVLGLVVMLPPWALTASGCSTESRLRVEGKTPFVRCLAGPVPDGERTLRAGRSSLIAKGRTLTATGLAHPLQIAAFSAPGFGPPLTKAQLADLDRSSAQLVLMLGGLGETDSEARATLTALASLERPVLFVAGGRDRWPVLELLADPDAPWSKRIMDATPMHELRIGKHTFMVVAGAESGRYAVDDESCGYTAADLAERQKEAAAEARTPGPRWLLSWHAPAAAPGQRGITRSESGLDTGAWNLSRFATQLGVLGGVYAWPSTQAGRSVQSAAQPTQLLVPRLFGPRQERDDGSLAPLGFALITLGETTLEPSR